MSYRVEVEFGDESNCLTIHKDDLLQEEHYDYGEPEDNSFGRDWGWVKGALERAYEFGLKDGIALCESKSKV